MTQRNPSFDVATVASFMTCLEDLLRADQRPVWGFWRKALSLAVGGLPAEGSDVVLWAEHPEGVRGCMRLCPCTTRQLGTSSVCGALFLHYFIPLPLVLSMFECSWKRGNRNFSVCPWQPLPVLCTLFVAYEFLIFISTTFSLWL